ncbi:MAG: helix-turn-helix domain-containing protein [Plectolyngbya sp. WJT66-NPBG17]|jgi:DNA-binding Xre family transcriptional regulator|nr:helix-turn-helix domain-containing protein [Plectolyngbya sp. WJT66-NPBG17]MBW4523696.1 helix-turn-helix domain-containing protein [Phormidium tanganyikae FI6-MK23]
MSDYTPQIRELMRSRNLTTFRELRDRTGISEKQLLRLRRGQLQQLRLETLTQFAAGLELSLTDLLSMFDLVPPNAIQKEYDRLQTQLIEQRETLLQEFQQSSLQTLEPWLLQWSAAAYAAQQNPQAPAVKLLPLVRPIEQLLQQWGIEQTAIVGSEVPYDPQQHQLMGGAAEPGDLVRVRYAGYQQYDRLLYRAKVSPV